VDEKSSADDCRRECCLSTKAALSGGPRWPAFGARPDEILSALALAREIVSKAFICRTGLSRGHVIAASMQICEDRLE
jgi:hypothetical protein